MPTTTVRIRNNDHASLRAWAEEDDLSLTDEIAAIIEEKRRERFFDEADRAYARLKEDPEAWENLQEEYRSLEGTLMDGLEEWPWEGEDDA